MEYLYCPKCKSRLYAQDEKYMQAVGVCSACVTWDSTPDKRYKKAFEENKINEACSHCPLTKSCEHKGKRCDRLENIK